jgi:peptidyl-prolyl cis-trans isomerase D
MFDAVRNNKRIVQVFLVLITLPFAFFGVDSYVRNSSAGSDVAKIGETRISQQQFDQALREQQERLRSQMGGKIDPRLFDSPEARKAILNDLVDQRLLMIEATNRKMFASDDAVRGAVGAIESFKIDGKFSSERYESALRAQGMTPAGFEAQLRQDITLQQLAGGLGQSGILPRTVSERLLGLQMERREVMEYRLPVDSYLDKVKLSEDAAQKFYEQNIQQFDTPEQVRAEYVVLSMETIGAALAVGENEVKDWYERHKERYQQPEERRASHILIAAADKADKPKAKAKAEQLLKEVQKAPGSFADLARKNSQDPGSAAKGGDLGFFGRGMMVKPFEDAVFIQKVGEISALVESDFGFHIIQVTGIHAAKEKPFAEVKAEIQDELKKAGASRKFAEAAEAFSNMVYEQADSLKPVADKYKLAIRQSDWLGRLPVASNGPLANEKLLSALFSDDAIKSKRNTEAVEVASNTLVAARVFEHKPSARQPFASVRAGIESLLKRQEAQALARKEGETRLESLKKGEDKLAWGAAKTISRLDSRLIQPAALAPVFRLDAGKLPGYVGVEMPGIGYSLFKLSRVDAGEKLDAARRQAMISQLEKLAMQEDVQTYLAALRTRYKVEINKAVLESKDK